jgi:hypothetical protein
MVERWKAEMLGFASLYVALTGVLMALNSALFPQSELLWTAYWIIWTLAFAPAVLVTCFVAAGSEASDGSKRRSYVATLVLILATLETCYALDVHAGTLALVLIGVAVGTYAIFRLAAARSGRQT